MLVSTVAPFGIVAIAAAAAATPAGLGWKVPDWVGLRNGNCNTNTRATAAVGTLIITGRSASRTVAGRCGVHLKTQLRYRKKLATALAMAAVSLAMRYMSPSAVRPPVISSVLNRFSATNA